MPLSRHTYRRTVELLTPYVDTGNRQSLCQLAFVGTPLVNQINYSGANAVFAAHIVDHAVKFGTLDDGPPALLVLLDTLRGQVGGNVATQIDELATVIRAELAGPVSNEPPTTGFSLSWVMSGLVVLLVVAGGGWLALGREPAATPSLASTTIPTADIPRGDVSLEVFYADADGLYVMITNPSDLRGIAMETVAGRTVLIDDFSVLESLGGQTDTGTCLSYIQAGTLPIPPRRCSGGNVFETTLNQRDVFWYDFVGNRLLDMTVYRFDEIVSVCAAGAACEIATAR